MAMTLDYLGELVRQLPADVRTLRTEVAAMREELAELKAEPDRTVRVVSELIRASEKRLMGCMAAFEAHVDTRVDRMEGD